MKAFIFVVFLFTFAHAAPEPRLTAEEQLKELKNIESNLQKHVSNIKTQGSLGFDALEAILKVIAKPGDQILITKIEKRFASYFDDVANYKCGPRIHRSKMWIIEKPEPKSEELKDSQEGLEKAEIELKEFVANIADVKKRMEEAKTEAKTDDDKHIVLFQFVREFTTNIPKLEQSLHDLQFAVAKFEDFVRKQQ